MAMLLPHHRKSLARAVARLKANLNVLAVILAGSLAHGYARRGSDIDLVIIVSDREYRRRIREGALGYYETESCDYKGGYVDGKYSSLAFLEAVASRGSDPARFAFRDATVVFSRIRPIRGLLSRIVRYPARERDRRIARFLGQLEAWKWYYYESLKVRDAYLRMVALSKLVLFGCRLILARNGSLYPYHKWMLREVEKQKRRPRGVTALIRRMLARPEPKLVERFTSMVKRYAGTGKPDQGWPGQFMRDSELNWMDGNPPVDDL